MKHAWGFRAEQKRAAFVFRARCLGRSENVTEWARGHLHILIYLFYLWAAAPFENLARGFQHLGLGLLRWTSALEDEEFPFFAGNAVLNSGAQKPFKVSPSLEDRLK